MNIGQAQAKFLRSSIDQMLSVHKKDIEKVNGMDNMIAKYAISFLENAKDNLNKADAISSGALEKSMDFNVEKSATKVTINFEALDYYKFVDKGVQGTGDQSGKGLKFKKKNSNSPYKFKNMYPSPNHVQAIKKWISDNNLTAQVTDISRWGGTQREQKGLKMPIRTAAWLVARQIKMGGLKATNFWQDAFDDTFKDFAVDMSRALGRTISVNLQQMAEEFKDKGTQIPQ